MSVEITEDGAVVAAGQPVDYATAYTRAVDNSQKITSLVEDTKAFVTVIAEAEIAPLDRQQSAVREAFTAGRPKQPGGSWNF